MEKNKKILSILLTIFFIITFFLIITLLFGIWEFNETLKYSYSYKLSSMLTFPVIGIGMIIINFIIFYALLNIKTKNARKKDAFRIKKFFYIIFVIPMLLNIYIPIMNDDILNYILLYAIIIIIYSIIINKKIKNLKN